MRRTSNNCWTNTFLIARISKSQVAARKCMAFLWYYLDPEFEILSLIHAFKARFWLIFEGDEQR